MNDHVKIGQASSFTGLSPQTLRTYFDKGLLTGYTTSGGTRMFNYSSLQTLSTNICNAPKENVKQEYIIYVRVSSKKQQDDLERQLEYIRSRLDCPEKYTVVSDIGSGINFKKKGIKTILDKCLQGTVKEIVVAHKDRLCRFAYDLFEYVINSSGGKIRVLSDESEHKSGEQELAEDLLSIITIYSCRQMGKRKYRKRDCQVSQNTYQSN